MGEKEKQFQGQAWEGLEGQGSAALSSDLQGHRSNQSHRQRRALTTEVLAPRGSSFSSLWGIHRGASYGCQFPCSGSQ